MNLIKAMNHAYANRHFKSGVIRSNDFDRDGYGTFNTNWCFKYQLEFNKSNVVAVFGAASTIEDLLRQFEAEMKVNFLENELKLKIKNDKK